MLIEKIAKELGLELEQEFNIDKREYINDVFKFTKYGLVYRKLYNQIWKPSSDILMDLICGKITVVWKPKEGETYYTLDPYFGYREDTWENLDAEIRMFNNGFICKTKEEIIELSEYLIEQVKKFKKSREK